MISQILIPVSGLKLGNHHFTYTLNKKFFDQFSSKSEFQGEFETNIIIEKSELLILVRFEVMGHISLLCSRCNDLINSPLLMKDKHIFKYGNITNDFNDDGISVINHDTYELDLTYLIYELIVLSIPLRPLHEEGECDEKTLRILQEILVKDNKKDEIDPRWSKLNDLNKEK